MPGIHCSIIIIYDEMSDSGFPMEICCYNKRTRERVRRTRDISFEFEILILCRVPFEYSDGFLIGKEQTNASQ